MVKAILVVLLAMICSSYALAQNLQDFIPGAVKEVEAKYSIVSADRKTVSLITDGQAVPSNRLIPLSDDSCMYLPGNAQGGVCMKICGGGIFVKPSSYSFEWRVAGQGHNAPWEPCARTGNGCRAFNSDWMNEHGEGRVCATFLVNHASPAGDRDFRFNVNLESPLPKPTVERLFKEPNPRISR